MAQSDVPMGIEEPPMFLGKEHVGNTASPDKTVPDSKSFEAGHAGLNTKQIQQTEENLLRREAIRLRNRVATELVGGPYHHELHPRNGTEEDYLIVKMAIDVERELGDHQNGAVIVALKKMRDEMKRVFPEVAGQDLAEKIVSSLRKNPHRTALRDPQLLDSPGFAKALLKAAEIDPTILRVIQKMIRHRRKMRKLLLQQTEMIRSQEIQLRQDAAFPILLNNKAFLEDVDSDPQNAKGLFVFFDVANFKKFNDKWGNNFTDAVVLAPIAEAFSSGHLNKKAGCHTLCSRCASSGAGDEFVVFLRGVQDQLAAAHFVARHFQRVLQSVGPSTLIENLPDELSASLELETDSEARKIKTGALLADIRSSIDLLSCKIGVVPRAGKALHDQMKANKHMADAKPYTEVPYATVLDMDPGNVWNPLERTSVAMDGRTLKPGERA